MRVRVPLGRELPVAPPEPIFHSRHSTLTPVVGICTTSHLMSSKTPTVVPPPVSSASSPLLLHVTPHHSLAANTYPYHDDLHDESLSSVSRPNVVHSSPQVPSASYPSKLRRQRLHAKPWFDAHLTRGYFHDSISRQACMIMRRFMHNTITFAPGSRI